MSHALACNRASTKTNTLGYAFRAAVLFEACSFLVQGAGLRTGMTSRRAGHPNVRRESRPQLSG